MLRTAIPHNYSDIYAVQLADTFIPISLYQKIKNKGICAENLSINRQYAKRYYLKILPNSTWNFWCDTAAVSAAVDMKLLWTFKIVLAIIQTAVLTLVHNFWIHGLIKGISFGLICWTNPRFLSFLLGF